MKNLLTVLPYCLKDHEQAHRLLQWIRELDGHLSHPILLVADDAVPMEHKKEIDALGKEVFDFCETIPLKCPAPVGLNYHAPAAFMFLNAMGHIDSCFKSNWLWLEPDAVPLRSGWLDALSDAYYSCPKRFLGSITKPNQKDVPSTVMFATAVYPNCAYEELKQFCSGKEKAFDMAFSDYVVPRAQNTPLIHHCFGSPTEVPTFKDIKLPTDGPNVGTLESLNKEAVLFHRCKGSSLIDLLRKAINTEPEVPQALTPIIEDETIAPVSEPEPLKPKRQGHYYPRKPKQEPSPQQP